MKSSEALRSVGLSLIIFIAVFGVVECVLFKQYTVMQVSVDPGARLIARLKTIHK